MAAINIPVQHLRSFTAGAIPTSAQLLQGQIAVNVVDKKFYTLDNTGAVQQIGVALSQLATVAQTGNYNDLSNKPDVQSAYVLPAASATTLGGVTISSAAATGLAVTAAGALTNSGVLTVAGRAGAVTLTGSDITLSGSSTTLPNDLLSGTNTTIATKYLPSSITGGLAYQGVWNASTNSPSLASGGIGPGGTQLPNGDYYVVSTAGSTALDGISTWTVGDLALVSNGVWTRIANSGSSVTSVNGQTGVVTLTASNITGLATVATSGLYSDLSGTPAAYSLPAATTTSRGGVQFNPNSASAGSTTSGLLASVAATGSYNDLLNLPVSPSVARLPVNLQGNPNITQEVFYIFTEGCQFLANFSGSMAYATFASGTAATVRIMQYPAATPTTGTQIGTLTIASDGSGSFTSTGTPVFAAGDKLSYQFATTNLEVLTIGLRGTWTS